MREFFNNLADKTEALFKGMPDSTLLAIEIVLLCIAAACIITAIVIIILRCKKKKQPAVCEEAPAEVAAPAKTEAVAAEDTAEKTDSTSAISDSDLPWEYIRKVIVPGEVVEPAAPTQPAEPVPESTASISVDSPRGNVRLSVSGTEKQVNDLLSGKTMVIFANDINFNMASGAVTTTTSAPASPVQVVEQIPVEEEIVPLEVADDEVKVVEKPVVAEPVVEEPAVEEPAVEEPAVEEIAEEPAVEEPVVEEVAEEPAKEEPEVIVAAVDEKAEDDDENEDDDDDDALFGADGNRRTIRKSFTARLTLATPERQEYYSRIKNELLRYKGIKCRRSWNGESFNKGRTQVAKIAIKGKTLSIYFGVLNFEDYIDSKYHFEDVSDTKKYADTPIKMKVKSNRAVGYVFELLSEIAGKMELKYINNEEVSYLPEPATYAELVEKGEIRIYEK